MTNLSPVKIGKVAVGNTINLKMKGLAQHNPRRDGQVIPV
jgi:hypothetical protein